MTHITPTVGRVVWFYEDIYCKKRNEPTAAMVTKVRGDDRHVDLVTYPDHTAVERREWVPLIQEGEDAGARGGCFCEWMPYQIGQAKKHAEPEPNALELGAAARNVT